MSLHPTAAQGFASAASEYERGRPGYPAEGIGWLAERTGIGPGSTVVDLAAGTGKLTRMLVPRGARVIAVEPVAAMRSMLTEAVRGVEVLSGVAESMPLPSGCADLVTVAQAFHWFANDAALAEIHRVLRPRGTLALLWNRRDMSQPIQQALDEILARYRGDEPTYNSGAWRWVLEKSQLFCAARGPAGNGLELATFTHSQHLGVTGAMDRVMSVSFVATLPDAAREQLVAELHALLAGQPDPIELRYTTEIALAVRA